jgi:hypothetical protein
MASDTQRPTSVRHVGFPYGRVLVLVWVTLMGATILGAYDGISPTAVACIGLLGAGWYVLYTISTSYSAVTA